MSSAQDLKKNVVHLVLKKRVHKDKKDSNGSWSKGEIIGSGAYGCVYKAMGKDGQLVAIKEVSIDEKGGSKAIEAIRQLKQEIAILSKIQHSNVVGYLGSERHGDKMWMILELATKGSLAKMYQKSELLHEDIKRYTRQIVCGLKHLHDQNIIHRDLKCANVLVDSCDQVKLADFGLAQEMADNSTLNAFVGTPHWMAPELLNPKRSGYTLKADIWSLGCTVLEMATRRSPFGVLEPQMALLKLMKGQAPPIPDNLQEDMRNFISQCLQVEAQLRPTCEELLEHPFLA